MAANASGATYFLLIKSGQLNIDSYQQVLSTGEYQEGNNHFILVDKTGQKVAPNNLRIQNSLLVYPGNPGQVLVNYGVSPEQWQFKAPTERQKGGGLAVLAGELTNDRGGQAFPLPTRFDGYGAQFKSTSTQEELGLKQLQRLQTLQGEGQHVIVPLTVNPGVFSPEQGMVQVEQTEKRPTVIDDFVVAGEEEEIPVHQSYYLAFWGGIVASSGESDLPGIYVEALKNLPQFDCETQIELLKSKRVVLAELQKYAKADFNSSVPEDSKRVRAVSFFGSVVGHRHEAAAHALAKQIREAENVEKIHHVLTAASNNLSAGGYQEAVKNALQVLSQRKLSASQFGC